MAKKMAITLAAAFLVLQLWASWGSGRTDPPPAGKDGTLRETPGLALAAPPPELSAAERVTKFDSTEFIVSAGTVRFDFDRAALQRLGAIFMVRGAVEEAKNGNWALLAIDERSTFALRAKQDIFEPAEGGHIAMYGAFFVDNSGERVVIGNMRLVVGPGGRFALVDTLNEDAADVKVFDMASAMVDFFAPTLELQILAELVVDEAWAARIARPGWGGVRIGTVTVEAIVVPWVEGMEETSGDRDEEPGSATVLAGTIGPDVIVADLQSVRSYGHLGNIHAYAVGTNACNIGDERANWISHTNAHPVILQNMYRLKDDAFEQIGMSWVKHGFYAVSWDSCSPCNDPTNGTQLGVGCSDPYSASLNGVQDNMSKLSDVNPYTGLFPYPWTVTEYDPTIGKRLQVHTADLDPALNAGATYFVQGHYITADDATAGNGENNASYRPVEVTEELIDDYRVTPIEQTVRMEPAVRAWQDYDPAVVETDMRVPGEGLFILAAKAVDLSNGVWRFSYALQNLNSNRSGGSFTVPLPEGAVLTNVGFHDVDYHSGEVYDGTDWSHVIENGAITWFTENYEANPNANALRYSTLYSFRFDANVEPTTTTVTLSLFRPGIPGEVSASSVGPDAGMIDCNSNGLADRCDLDCYAEGCVWPCGGSIDCNGNGAPDECEPDCNGNGVADTCDISGGASEDCNENTVPDECEPDCDGNGIPDDCVPPADADLDGVDDCHDQCPSTTPEGYCACPLFGECCWMDGFWCLPGYSTHECIEADGVPECLAAPCRVGCLLGDFDGDGDLDLYDFGMMQIGYAAEDMQDFIQVFDFDLDGDIDLDDYAVFHLWQSDPK